MLKLNRLNRKGNEVECLIVVEDIDGLTEKEIEDEPLYDANGNQVDTKVNENIYQVHFKNGREIYVKKETYQKLIKKLSVEEL